MSIIYTLTDEAPRLATYSLLPIVQAFAGAAGVSVTTADISLANRILAKFPEFLSPEQQVLDALAELGAKTVDPQVNLIKLPNISASLPQLKAAIAELQSQGFAIPDYPDNASNAAEMDIAARYDAVKGSAVNPVLRQGNSDRRAPAAVKAYARQHPHRNSPWDSGDAGEGTTAVATMSRGDFYHNEATMLVEAEEALTIRFTPSPSVEEPERRLETTGTTGTPIIWRSDIKVHPGDVFDATFMSATALDEFLKQTIDRAATEKLLYSVHLKATMMKISDPVIFGHAVKALLPNTFAKYGTELAKAGVSPDNGLTSMAQHLAELPHGAEIREAIATELANGPALAMVDSAKGITAFHMPNDIIIDASLPALIRAGGQMWGADGALHNVLAVIPDSSYAGVYQAAIEDCAEQGPIDPATAGSVANVGLMAQAAEEYGSHDKTFISPAAGVVEVISTPQRHVEPGNGNRNADGQAPETAETVLISQEVQAGDIWRACLTRHQPIENWVELAISRGRITGEPVVFWLDLGRPHDAVLCAIVEEVLGRIDTEGVEIHIMAPAEACRYSLDRLRAGLNTISVTGNVLRDYLTDLFPILEVGTSAKMLSIVPLMAGGGLFETGAGGSAPKHVAAFVADNHLRWDSLGEFLALAASFEHLSQVEGNPQAVILAETLDAATAKLLEQNNSPKRNPGELDNRGSHFYLALYWAQALAAQSQDKELAAKFQPFAQHLAADVETILAEINAGAETPIDLGGYYHPNPTKTEKAMRPSKTFNQALATVTNNNGLLGH